MYDINISSYSAKQMNIENQSKQLFSFMDLGKEETENLRLYSMWVFSKRGLAAFPNSINRNLTEKQML